MAGLHSHASHEIVFLNVVTSAVLLAIVGDSSTDNSFSDSSCIGFIGS
jgi:hypothetical protein